MKLYFAGAEVKGWRDLLAKEKVPDVALSYVGLQRRLRGSASWALKDNFTAGQSILLDSGGFSLNRDDATYTVERAKELSISYMDFVSANAEEATLIAEFDARILGQDYIRAMREDFYNSLPSSKFMPVWHEDDGLGMLDRLASEYETVAVDIKATGNVSAVIPQLNSIVNRTGVKIHGAGITSRELMKQFDWHSVSSTSWLSPSIYGDTIMWIEKEKTLKRYPKAYKSSRRQHRMMFIDNGFDAEKIESDDPGELLRLSLWSWQQFVNHLNRQPVTNQPWNGYNPSAETPGTEVDILASEGGTGNLPAIVERRPTTMIPLMTIQRKQGANEEEIENFTVVRSESMRACNSCFLRTKCIGFMAGANCLYNIPVEVKTREQLQALQAALVEMQAQRVLFMKMAEDLEGGYADPNLSSEMDRLQRMLKAKTDSEKDGFRITLEAEGTSGTPGAFSRLFGSEAAQKLSVLPQPMMADEVITDEFGKDIVDAEIV